MSQVALSGTMPNGEVGVSYSFTPTTTNGSGSETYSISAGTLPEGLSLNTTSGVISGTPTTVGNFTATLEVQDSSGTSTLSLTPTIYAAMAITSSGSYNAEDGVLFSQQMVVTGGGPNKTYSISNGSLPSGLNLNASTGRISGTPSGTGSFSPTLSVTDGYGTVTQALSFTVVAQLVVTVGGITAWQNQATSTTPTLSGGRAPFTFSLNGQLPNGLNFNTTTGEISGTCSTAVTTSVIVIVQDSCQALIRNTVEITISPSIVLLGTISSYDINTPINFTPTVNGGASSHTFSITSGSLPSGVSLNTTTGAITGESSAAGTFSFTLTGSDASGTSNLPLTLTVNPSLTLVTTNLTLEVGTTINTTLVVEGGSGTNTFTIATGAFPAGLSLSSEGVLSGTTTVTGAFDVTLKITDGDTTISPLLNGTVVAALAVNYTFPLCIKNKRYQATPTITGGSTVDAVTISGVFPNGMTYDPITGIISGTPLNSGTFPLAVVAKDAAGGVCSTEVTLTVIETLLYTGTPPKAEVGVPYSFIPSVVYNTGAVTFQIAQGVIPDGLTLNQQTGEISGTPAQDATSATLILSVADTIQSITPSVSLVIISPLEISLTPSTFYFSGSTVTITPTVTGGSGVLHFSSNLSIPPGMMFDPTNGTLTGPLPNTTLSYVINVSDDLTSAHCTVQLPVIDQLSLEYASPIELESGIVANVTPEVSGGFGTKTFTIASGTLPTGLSLNAQTGAITGSITTNTVVTETITITVTDSSGNDSCSTTISCAPALTMAIAPTFGVATHSYNITPQVNGGVPPYRFSVQSNPGFGLSVNPGSGVLAASKLTNSGTVSVDLVVIDSLNARVMVPVTFTIYSPITISGSPSNGEVGAAYTFNPQLVPGYGTVAASVNVPLPTGLMLNPTTGSITGTPTSSGSYEGVLTVSDQTGSAEIPLAFTLYPTLQVGGTMPAGIVGVPFTFTPTLTGGSGSNLFSIIGTLPAGLTWNSKTATITGTPTAVSASPITIGVVDGYVSKSTTYNLTVVAPLSISGTCASAVANEDFDFKPIITGGMGTRSAVLSTPVPAGLQFNTVTGEIWGTPEQDEAYTAMITVTDQTGSVELPITITIGNPLQISGTAPNGVVGAPYFFTPTATGGNGTYQYVLSSALPSGLTLDMATGAISGTTSQSGPISVTLTVTDGVVSVSIPLAWSMNAALTVFYAPVSTSMGQTINVNPVVTGGTGSIAYTVTKGVLPSGLSLDPDTGILSGAATVIGQYTVTISAQDDYTVAPFNLVITLVDLGSTGVLNPNDVAIQSLIQQYRALAATPQTSATVLQQGVLFNRIVTNVLASPTTTALKMLGILQSDFRNTLFSESVFYNTLNQTNAPNAAIVSAVYTAYRAALVYPASPFNFGMVLKLTSCQPLVMYLKQMFTSNAS